MGIHKHQQNGTDRTVSRKRYRQSFKKVQIYQRSSSGTIFKKNPHNLKRTKKMQLFCLCLLLGVFIGASNAENASDAIMQADVWTDFTDGIKGKLNDMEVKISKISGKVTKLEAAAKFTCINYSRTFFGVTKTRTVELLYNKTFKENPSWIVAMSGNVGNAKIQNGNIKVKKDKLIVDISSDVSASITLRMMACGI